MTPVETDATISYFKECLHAAEQIAGLKEEQITRLEKHIREGTVLEGVDDTNFPENPESTGHGLGYWLRDSGAAFFGKEVSQIMQTLARQQRLHREETITRLRRYNSDTDAIIDSQREEDEAIRKKFGID